VREQYLSTTMKMVIGGQKDAEKAVRRIDRYVALVTEFEKLVPPLDPKQPKFDARAAEEEKSLLYKWTSPCRLEVGALKNVDDFLGYWTTTVATRAKRAAAYSGWISVLPKRIVNDPTKAVLVRAFSTLEVDSLGTITADSFHASLMALATAGWHPLGQVTTLETIREDCLRQQTATLSEFKSFLYLYCTMSKEPEDEQLLA
jgi:hypothetical protein